MKRLGMYKKIFQDGKGNPIKDIYYDFEDSGYVFECALDRMYSHSISEYKNIEDKANVVLERFARIVDGFGDWGYDLHQISPLRRMKDIFGFEADFEDSYGHQFVMYCDYDHYCLWVTKKVYDQLPEKRFFLPEDKMFKEGVNLERVMQDNGWAGCYKNIDLTKR